MQGVPAVLRGTRPGAPSASAAVGLQIQTAVTELKGRSNATIYPRPSNLSEQSVPEIDVLVLYDPKDDKEDIALQLFFLLSAFGVRCFNPEHLIGDDARKDAILARALHTCRYAVVFATDRLLTSDALCTQVRTLLTRADVTVPVFNALSASDCRKDKYGDVGASLHMLADHGIRKHALLNSARLFLLEHIVPHMLKLVQSGSASDSTAVSPAALTQKDAPVLHAVLAHVISSARSHYKQVRHQLRCAWICLLRLCEPVHLLFMVDLSPSTIYP